MATSDHFYRKADEALRRAQAASDVAERARLLDEAVRMHLLALERLAEECAPPEPRSFEPSPARPTRSSQRH